jgi:hypothetical protein
VGGTPRNPLHRGVAALLAHSSSDCRDRLDDPPGLGDSSLCNAGAGEGAGRVVAAALLREKPFTAVDGMMGASNTMDSKTAAIRRDSIGSKKNNTEMTQTRSSMKQSPHNSIAALQVPVGDGKRAQPPQNGRPKQITKLESQLRAPIAAAGKKQNRVKTPGIQADAKSQPSSGINAACAQIERRRSQRATSRASSSTQS